MKLSFSSKHLILGSVSVSLVVLLLSALFQGNAETAESALTQNLENRAALAQYLDPYLTRREFPAQMTMKLSHQSESEYNIRYTIDAELQKAAEDLLQRYRPDYSSIFMMDAKTGKVLVYASYEKNATGLNLLKKASYPAASVFKIVTATAAVDNGGMTPQDKIRFNGGNWTLYRKNVLFDKINRWTRTVSLREAFAKSMNTPFGKIGLNHIEPKTLENYAERFMFNQQIPADFPVEPGVAVIPEEKDFSFTEVASGYNRRNRMSPIQGAMIAATVINDGKMVIPYMVDEIRDSQNNIVHQGAPLEAGAVMSAESAESVKQLMEATIVSGTSRKSFFTLRRDKKFHVVQMGGKTGHLNGDDPKGQVDWFVGFASSGDRQIAIAAVTVNKKFWTVKSSYISQTMFKKAFSTPREIASNH